MPTLLVWIGTALTLVGLAGVVATGFAGMRARREGGEDEALRARLQRLVLWNMGAFGIAALGLMVLVMGVILG